MYNDGMWDGGNDPITISTEWGDYDLILGDNVILNMLNYLFHKSILGLVK